MFKVEKNNEKIGKYLSSLIDSKYKSKRAFCVDYISTVGQEPTQENINNMSNRISQIVNGKNAIQMHDLPYFTSLLDVSCEQILSAGEYSCPISSRVTNYSIACSKNPEEWERYINRKDKLILNTDEYCKTVLDYALEFSNYEFIKYLMDKKYIWFDDREEKNYIINFGAGTSIKPRNTVDYDLQNKLMFEDELRIRLIALAADNKDIEMLDSLRARENIKLYNITSPKEINFAGNFNKKMVEHIASSDETILDYFTDTFEIKDVYKNNPANVFMFPYIAQLLNCLIAKNSHFAETALKKALKHNKETYKKLCNMIFEIKNSETKDIWLRVAKENFEFCEETGIICFKIPYDLFAVTKMRRLITNVARVTRKTTSPVLRYLAEELNESYDCIRNLINNQGEENHGEIML